MPLRRGAALFHLPRRGERDQLRIGQEHKVSTRALGADGKQVDPIRPVINLTIARPAVDANGANGKLIDSAAPLLPVAKP